MFFKTPKIFKIAIHTFAVLALLALMLMQVTSVLADRGDTVRLSVSSSGTEGNDTSYRPAISSDGHYVAFYSNANNLVSDDDKNTNNNHGDIFVRDTVANTTTRVSLDTGGKSPNDESNGPAISADGRYVAFYSYASDLVAGDTNGQSDIFVRDTVANTTTRVSVNNVGAQANNGSFNPSISADGRYVVFQTTATNLGNDTNGVSFDIYMRDTATNTTKLLSKSTAGVQGNGQSYSPVISADGNYVAYYSVATNLVAGDTNGASDVFVRDIAAGTTTRVSVSNGGAEGNSYSNYPSISSDGRYVAFVSAADNLIAGLDDNHAEDIFVRDTLNNNTTRISVADDGSQANAISSYASAISGDGQYIAFASNATNLLGPGVDTNGATDIFVRDTVNNTTTRVSLNTSLDQADSPCVNPAISADGNFVGFDSPATNLVDGDTNDVSDIFLHDQTFTLDTTPPDVTINKATGQTDPTSNLTINFTAVFSEPIKPATFISSDLTLGGTTAGTLSANITQIAPNDGTTFNIAVSGLSGNGEVTASLDADKVTDLVGNGNTASTSTDNSVTYVDITPPGVSMSSTSASPINGKITVTVTFSEPVTGFVVGDITVSNGTKSNFVTSSTSVYKFDLTPTVNGTVTADIAAGVAQDPAGNNNTVATQFSRTYDGTPPTTTINSQPPNPDTDTTPTFNFSGDDGAGSGVASFQCKMDSGAYAACTSPFTSSALLDGSHTFSVYAIDNASNADASPATYTWVLDTTPPTVVSSTRTNPNPTANASVDFTVTFSEAVTGVDTTDFSLTTTTITDASITGVSGSGATYTVSVNTGSYWKGTIHLNVLDDNTIKDVVNHPLNGAFTTGETYTVNKKLKFTSIGSHDGWILESTETSNKGGTTKNAGGKAVKLGDDAGDKQYRAILSFKTMTLPDNAVITSVALRIKRKGIVGGGNPIKMLNGFKVDIKNGFFGTAASLQGSDFQAAANHTYGPFKPKAVNLWYTININSAKAYINKLSTKNGLTQIRLRFNLDDNDDSIANIMKLYSGNAPAPSRPVLVIKYYVP